MRRRALLLLGFLLLAPGTAAAQDPEAADRAWRAGDTALAERLYAGILAADSTHDAALHRMALIRAWAGRYVESLALFDRMLRLYPDAIEARIDRARVLAWSGDIGRATAAIGGILEERPDSDAARAAREEIRALAAAAAPLASPAFARESDTDGNRMTTVSAMARFRPVAGLTLRADAYTRAAREEGPAGLDHAARGGAVTAMLALGSGWGLAGTIGASMADADHGAQPALALSVSTPGGGPVRATLAVRRQAFDATARLIANGIVTTEATAALAARPRGRADLDLAGGVAWFESRASGGENRRWSADASASWRVLAPLTLGLTARGFGFHRDLADGYFDPDFFGLAEVLARLRVPLGPFALSAEGAPGAQKVGSDGDVRPAGRVQGAVTWPIGPGRELAVGALYANAGLQRLSAAADADYAYRAITARLTWTF